MQGFVANGLDRLVMSQEDVAKLDREVRCVVAWRRGGGKLHLEGLQTQAARMSRHCANENQQGTGVGEQQQRPLTTARHKRCWSL